MRYTWRKRLWLSSEKLASRLPSAHLFCTSLAPSFSIHRTLPGNVSLMSRLDHAIAALDVLGTVVQAVPVVGENLKSAVEIVTKTCEMIKVRNTFSALYMRLTRHAEDEGESRGVRAARGSRGQAVGSCRKHDHEGQSGEAEGNGRKYSASAYVRRSPYHPSRVMLMQPSSTLKEIKSTIDARLQTPTPTGKFGSVKKFIRTKGKDAVRVSEDQEKVKKLREQLDRAIEEFGVRARTTQNLLCVLIAFIS
jgi:hypothetical protein